MSREVLTVQFVIKSLVSVTVYNLQTFLAKNTLQLKM